MENKIKKLHLPDLPAIEADVDAPSQECEFSINFAWKYKKKIYVD